MKPLPHCSSLAAPASLRSGYGRACLILISLVILLTLASCLPASTQLSLNEPAGLAFSTTLLQSSPTLASLPTPEPTPPGGLTVFSPRLNTGVQPTTYLDTCEYLRKRWDPDLSAPGTIVAPFMFHSIIKAGHNVQAGDATSITAAYFADFMQHAHNLGFQTITSSQLVDFLENNAKIPPRSMILIIDDRRPGTVREHFLPYLEKYNWTVTLGYISGPASPSEWKDLESLAATGHIDAQAHGFLHNGSTYFVPETPELTILREIYAPQPLLYEHFGNWPVAFIWPGGDFIPRAVEVARQAGYHLGFTAYARGPLLYNWIPLGSEERAMNDPLMVLPRFWSTAAWGNLDEAVSLADQAKAFADAHKAEELAYLDQNCK